MQKKILSIRTLLIVGCIGLIIFLTLTSTNKQKNVLVINPVSLTANSAIIGKDVSLPARLKIPSLKVDSPIEYVGVNTNGAMDVPKQANDVAWFNLGPRPGEIGSAVIDGHSGYKNNIPAVFDNLYKLKVGDKVYVENTNGATLTFVIREIKSYNPKANALAVFNSNDGLSHLNLITCSGDWNTSEKTHSQRLIIFTDRVVE